MDTRYNFSKKLNSSWHTIIVTVTECNICKAHRLSLSDGLFSNKIYLLPKNPYASFVNYNLKMHGQNVGKFCMWLDYDILHGL